MTLALLRSTGILSTEHPFRGDSVPEAPALQPDIPFENRVIIPIVDERLAAGSSFSITTERDDPEGGITAPNSGDLNDEVTIPAIAHALFTIILREEWRERFRIEGFGPFCQQDARDIRHATDRRGRLRKNPYLPHPGSPPCERHREHESDPDRRQNPISLLHDSYRPEPLALCGIDVGQVAIKARAGSAIFVLLGEGCQDLHRKRLASEVPQSQLPEPAQCARLPLRSSPLAG
jgi:hypothetical protein